MNFKKIFTILGLSTSMLGVGFAVSYGIYQDKQPQIAKAVEYDDIQHEISFNTTELNTYTFSNLKNYLNTNYSSLYSPSILSMKYIHYEYEEQEQYKVNTNYVIYNQDEYSVDEYIYFTYSNNINSFENENRIEFNLLNGRFGDFYVYSYDENSNDAEDEYEYVNNLILNINNETHYNGIKTAVELDIQANQPQYSYLDFLYESIGLLVGGITGISSGIGNGLSTLVNDLAISSGAMSPFMSIIFVFGGIALALGLSRWVVNLISSLGQRNR